MGKKFREIKIVSTSIVLTQKKIFLGEDYLTFSGTTVNIGQGMNPKSGEFVAPEPGLYLFLVTCCTYDMKKCLISIRKNGKDVANLFDQDGDTNKVLFCFYPTLSQFMSIKRFLKRKIVFLADILNCNFIVF